MKEKTKVNMSLVDIVEQFELCDYQSIGGPLVNNTFFLALKKMSEAKPIPREVICWNIPTRGMSRIATLIADLSEFNVVDAYVIKDEYGNSELCDIIEEL